MSLVVVGTMAFDAIETPFGKTDKIVGGSATYVAYTATNFAKMCNRFRLLDMIFRKKK